MWIPNADAGMPHRCTAAARASGPTQSPSEKAEGLQQERVRSPLLLPFRRLSQELLCCSYLRSCCAIFHTRITAHGNLAWRGQEQHAPLKKSRMFCVLISGQPATPLLAVRPTGYEINLLERRLKHCFSTPAPSNWLHKGRIQGMQGLNSAGGA